MKFSLASKKKPLCLPQIKNSPSKERKRPGSYKTLVCIASRTPACGAKKVLVPRASQVDVRRIYPYDAKAISTFANIRFLKIGKEDDSCTPSTPAGQQLA